MTWKKMKFLFHFVHMCFIDKTDCKICVSDRSANALNLQNKKRQPTQNQKIIKIKI